MLGILGRTFVVPIAILIADQSIPPMDDDLGTLVDGDLPSFLYGPLLGRTPYGIPLGLLLADGPSVIPFHNMLIPSHFCLRIMGLSVLGLDIHCPS